jgi:hypothetical protein
MPVPEAEFWLDQESVGERIWYVWASTVVLIGSQLVFIEI